MFNKLKYLLPTLLTPYFFYWISSMYGYYTLIANYEKYPLEKLLMVSFILILSTVIGIALGKIFFRNKILMGSLLDLTHTLPILTVTFFGFYVINEKAVLGWFLIICLIPLHYIYLKFLTDIAIMSTDDVHSKKWKIIIRYKNKIHYVLLGSKSYRCMYNLDGVTINNSFIARQDIANVEKDIGKPLSDLDEDELDIVDMYVY